MNIYSSSQKEDRSIKLTSSERVQENTYPYQQEVNITEGSEFLDDAIRMRDQPLGETNVKENE